jgi:opacity protein-like surface antigen
MKSREGRAAKMAAKYKSLLLQLSMWLIPSGLILLSLTLCSTAQDEHRYTLHGGAGVSPLVGDISSRLDNGWHITVGGGYNFNPHFTTTLDYAYNGFGVSRRVLNEAQVPDGNSHMWSITLNPKLRLNRGSKFDPYVVGGVGYYRRTVEFTRPVLVQVFIFDPFFGGFFNTFARADQVLGRITEDGVGGSLGAGLDVKLGERGLKFFTEARYHYADTGRIPTRMVPVTFGLRW